MTMQRYIETPWSARPQITVDLMARTGLDDAILARLVHGFYDQVRADPLLGPVFAERVSDWPTHLSKMVAFWSSVALAPGPDDAFRAFGKAVFAEGALDRRTKQLIAVAVAHVTQCPWCIEGHVKAARYAGATGAQIMESIWVAAEMRAGAAFAHSIKALELIGEDEPGGAAE